MGWPVKSGVTPSKARFINAKPPLLLLYHPLTSNLLSLLGWIPQRLREQYRYWQWIRGSNIIIIVPDPPPGLPLSVARSAGFPASGEDCCCNFSSVWAVNNILCGAASHTVIDAHSAVISSSGSLPPDSHYPSLAHGRFMCIMRRENDAEKRGIACSCQKAQERLHVPHLTLPLWCSVPLNPECVFGKSLKMAVGTIEAGLFYWEG